MKVDALPVTIRVRMRDDLVVLPGVARGARCYTIEDPLTGKYYQVGDAEHQFLKHLDGVATLAEVRTRANRELGGEVFTPERADAAARWLLAAGLGSVPGTLPLANSPGTRPKRTAWLANPMFFRFPLLHPDAAVTALTPWLSWLYSPQAMLASLIVGIAAACVLAIHGKAFYSSANIFAPDQRFWALAVWLLLKFAHELSHAIVCKKFGGRVAEAGVAFVLFAPMPYVDVTASWRFRSKWERIYTAAAGMYFECLLASLAVLAWPLLEPGAARQACVQIATLALLGTVIFNANPLMRFDGYYILADLLETPNLYAESQRNLRWLAKRYLLGVAGADPAPGFPRRRLLLGYGVAAWVWRMLACISLVIAAAYLLHGAGLVVALTAAVAWWATPLVRLGRYLLWPPAGERPRRARFALISLGLLSLATAVFFGAPWPGAVSAPAMIDFDPLVHVRAVEAGFVREVRVADGQSVQTGEVIAVLDNEPLALEAAQLELALRQSEARCRALQLRRDLAALQAEEAQKEALASQLSDLQDRLGALTICAPGKGVVLARELVAHRGRYLKAGDELCLIAGSDRVVRGLIGQDKVKTFHAHIGNTVEVRLPGAPAQRGKLVDIEPSASRTPPHLAYCSLYGGPLAVTQRKAHLAGEGLEFVEPQFRVRVTLLADAVGDNVAGQRCEVRLANVHESMKNHLFRIVREWIRAKAPTTP